MWTLNLWRKTTKAITKVENDGTKYDDEDKKNENKDKIKKKKAEAT